MSVIARQTHLDSWTKRVLANCFKPNYQGWVMSHQKAISGFAIILRKIDECELLVIAIMPAYQRRGLGKRLLTAIFKIMASTQIRRMHLEVRCSNEKAICFYRALGFEEVGIRSQYYPVNVIDQKREDALLFSMSI